MIIEELDAGEMAPAKQAAPPKFHSRDVWDAFQNDATRAGMTRDGDKNGKGILDILKEAEE